MLFLLGSMLFGNTVFAQDCPVGQDSTLKSEVVNLPEIGVKILWDAELHKIWFLRQVSQNVETIWLGQDETQKQFVPDFYVLYETSLEQQYAKRCPQLQNTNYPEAEAMVGEFVHNISLILGSTAKEDGRYSVVETELFFSQDMVRINLYETESGETRLLMTKFYR